MAKVIYCSDMGADCDFVARGETLDEVLKVGAEHGNEFHGISEITPEMVEQVTAVVRDE